VALPEPQASFQGLLYRALNPLWAAKPLSGDGAALHGGRFNPKGQPALYCALTIMGAVAEANQIGRPFEPVTLICLEADLTGIFDATSPVHLAARGLQAADITAGDWRGEFLRSGQSQSQKVAETLRHTGYQGMKVPSFAKGALADAANLVLWRWDGTTVIDTEHRLK